MVTAEQRERDFMVEFRELLVKYRADIEVDVDFYGTAEVLVSMDSLYCGNDVMEEYSSFFLPLGIRYTD